MTLVEQLKAVVELAETRLDASWRDRLVDAIERTSGREVLSVRRYIYFPEPSKERHAGQKVEAGTPMFEVEWYDTWNGERGVSRTIGEYLASHSGDRATVLSIIQWLLGLMSREGR